MSQQEKMVQGLHDKLSAKLVGFDPTIIITIIQAIITAISGCKPSGKSLKEMATKPSILTRIRVRQALRNEGIRPLTSVGQQAEDAIFAIGAEASEGECGMMCQMCSEMS